MNPPAAAASAGGAAHAAAPGAAPPEYAPYPRLSPEEVAPPPPPPYHAATAAPTAYGANPYISSPAGGAATAPKRASPLLAFKFWARWLPIRPSEIKFGSFLIFFFFWDALVWCGFADTMDSVKDVLGKMGKRFGDAARKTETITGNFWQHCEFPFHCRLFTKLGSEVVALCFPLDC